MKKLYTLIFFVIGFVHYTCGQTKVEQLDELIGKYVEYGKFNGSVLVAEKGKVIYKKGFGLANAEWSIPNEPDTKHRLASITKQFTSMLILQLVSENKLKLDAPVTTYLPDYPKLNGDRVTIHHLLTHTSGIPSYTSMPGYMEMMHDHYRPEEIVRHFADSALEFTPGEKFNYSNSGYVLLGHIIEKITGSSYEDNLQSRIFSPLKMVNSGYDHPDSVIKNKASGYDKVGNEFRHSHYIDMSVPFAAGGIYSTVEDLYLWDQALYSEQLIPKKLLDKAFEKHIPAGRNYYGYGWETGSMAIGSSGEQVATIGHSGGINGFNTLITRIPSDRSLIVLLNNTSDVPLHELTVAINGILHNTSYAFPKKSIATELLASIQKEGLQRGLLHFKEIRESNNYYLHEGEMNTIGYQLLQTGKVKEAAAVFKLNVEAYPNSFNPYDSYGEALIALGDTIAGIENYKRSIVLNPDNENGVKVLRNLGVNTDNIVVKASDEELKILEGDYLVINPPSAGEKNWKIVFTVVDGILIGNDGGYRYKLVPQGDNKFINPDDGASLVFDTRDKNAITLTLFGKFNFRKII